MQRNPRMERTVAPQAASGRSSTRAAMRPSTLDVEVGVGRGVDLDEDALPRAGLGGVDDLLHPAHRHPRQRAGAAGVVERPAALVHVGDAVLELEEHVGAVVDAQAVAGAQVLVDPHPHGRTVARCSHGDGHGTGGSTVPPQPWTTSPTCPPSRRAHQAAHLAPPDRAGRRPLRLAARPATTPTRSPTWTAENAYSQAWFDDHAALVDELYERDQVAHPGDRRVGAGAARPVVVRHADRRGPVVPGLLPGPLDRHAPTDVILDCNVEADGHDYFDVHAVDPSPDHSLLAWSSDLDGGEVYTLRVRDLATGAELPDELTGTSSWGGVAWSADGQWLFYARPDDQMRPHEIWRHRLGTPVADDVLVATEPDERFNLDVVADAQRALDRHLHPQPHVVGGVADPGRRPDGRAACSCGRAPRTSSTASTTGTTASSC